MRGRKQSETLNIAFLDIMSCGLGAVILLFMLIKHNISDSPAANDPLQDEIQQLEMEKQNAEQTLKKITADKNIQTNDAGQIRRRISALRQSLQNKESGIKKSSSQLSQLQQDIKDTKIPKAEDPIEIDNINEENYLLGLKIEGKKIALLIDASASMTEKRLIEIIKIKLGSKADKINSSKWQRTKNIVRWLLARLPDNSEIIVIAYNDTVQFPGGKQWLQAGNEKDIKSILKDMQSLVPENATNLQKALKAAKDLRPDSLYIITDGLPTVGDSNYRNLNPFKKCNSLLGKSKKISGECRVRLFRQTITESAVTATRINVVLLPMEGDPDAINEYWLWAAPTGGLVISPAPNWP